MKKYDLAIIGSGMGGSMLASLNKDKNLVVFEKDKNLGGCASTFKRYGSYYNAGATTFVGYEQNHPVKDIFDKAGFIPDIQESKIAIRVLQNGKIVDRIKNFEEFIENINRVYPNKNNTIFWQTIKDLDERFWTLRHLYFSKYSLKSNLKSFYSFFEIFLNFRFDIFKSARGFIKDILGDIPQAYMDFIDSQLLITLQSTSKDISLLSMCLGLAYPFHSVFYVNNGMGSLFDALLKDIELKRKEEIIRIIREKKHFRIFSRNYEYVSKNVVLNSSIYDCGSLFEESQIKDYYDSFSFSDQSAFVINFKIKSKIELLHHYQIILDDYIPNCISKSFFISISSKDDKKLSKNGYSVTISSHTKANFWKDISKEEYEKQKLLTQEFIINKFLENFKNIKIQELENIFSATSKTFKRYINRTNCGGKAITFKNLLQTPTCTTPIKGLYNVGDTIFAGQGWPGVALGVNILNKELNE